MTNNPDGLSDARALLPCPHCGSVKIGMTAIRDGYEAWCRCGAAMSASNPNSRQRAMDGWNTRHSPPASTSTAIVAGRRVSDPALETELFGECAQHGRYARIAPCCAEAAAPKAASEDAAAAITQLDDNSEAMICAGCGTTRTIAGIKQMSETAFTCCPERKMIPAREMWRVWFAADAPKTASEHTCPFCTGAPEYQGSPEDEFCERHLRLYRKASAA